jgi:hypothetical protein
MWISVSSNMLSYLLVQQRRHNSTTLTHWYLLQIETPRVPGAAPHPDNANDPNAGAIGSTPTGQPVGKEAAMHMSIIEIDLLANKFNLPVLHFRRRSLDKRRQALVEFYSVFLKR